MTHLHNKNVFVVRDATHSKSKRNQNRLARTKAGFHLPVALTFSVSSRSLWNTAGRGGCIVS